MASEAVQYVDDVQCTAHSCEQAWLVSRRIVKGLAWLGFQDSARKRMRPSQQLGAWAGAVVLTVGDIVTKSVTKERWIKNRNKIWWLGFQADLSDKYMPTNFDLVDLPKSTLPDGFINFERTERLVGFIVYVSLTFTSFVPYLKGIYLTLNSWRKGRDVEGWMTPEAKNRARRGINKKNGDHPNKVKMVPRFRLDVEALMKFTASKDPSDVPVRASRDEAIYIVGNALDSGFGPCFWVKEGKLVDTEFGQWSFYVTKNESSNLQ